MKFDKLLIVCFIGLFSISFFSLLVSQNTTAVTTSTVAPKLELNCPSSESQSCSGSSFYKGKKCASLPAPRCKTEFDRCKIISNSQITCKETQTVRCADPVKNVGSVEFSCVDVVKPADPSNPTPPAIWDSRTNSYLEGALVRADVSCFVECSERAANTF